MKQGYIITFTQRLSHIWYLPEFIHTHTCISLTSVIDVNLMIQLPRSFSFHLTRICVSCQSRPNKTNILLLQRPMMSSEMSSSICFCCCIQCQLCIPHFKPCHSVLITRPSVVSSYLGLIR